MCICTCEYSMGTHFNTCTHIPHKFCNKCICFISVYRGVETGINLPRETGNSHTKRIIYHKLAHTELIPKNRVQDANFFNGSYYFRFGPDKLWSRCQWVGKMGLKNYILSVFTFEYKISTIFQRAREQ